MNFSGSGRYVSLAWVPAVVLSFPAIVCLLALETGCSRRERIAYDPSLATYVGSESCSECHSKQVEMHRGSHHDLAMQAATEESVLGEFADTTIEHYGVISRMYRSDGAFMVETEGPDGLMHEYQVKYVFGVSPLQQYMVEFPQTANLQEDKSGLPRIQVLPVCWDTKRRVWFYLNPPDVHERLSPQDDLHWTGIAQRWNTMCAECHSTNYRKEFTPGTFTSLATHSPRSVNQTGGAIGHYRSLYSEINVACESCHGPASTHVELARNPSTRWNRETGYGLADLRTTSQNELSACAPCHSRRGVIFGGFHAGSDYDDHYQLNLLTWPTYYADGQILDEDYEYGSFLQSKMFHKAIRCTDCHDPHSVRLKHSGNQVCTSCHQHPAAKYDSPAHHFHQPNSTGAQCVNCHMPETTYMQVDARRDHSLRIPRPDHSLLIKTPNACTGCHLKWENVAEEKRSALVLYQDWMQAARDGDEEVAAEITRVDQWCNEACDRWYGENRRREDHWGLAIAAGQTGGPNAVEQLKSVLAARGETAPFIARATAQSVLTELDPAEGSRIAEQTIADAHPMVRASAAGALRQSSDFARSTALLEKALEDGSRLVRFAAARSLLELPPRFRSPAGSLALERVVDEMSVGLQYNNDRAGAHLSLGSMAEQLGRPQQAISHYETSMVVEPAAVGPRTNLAALLTRQLEGNNALPHAVRESLEKRIAQMRSQELELLARDVALLENPPAMLVFRYGLALYLNDQLDEAAIQIIRAAELDPLDVTFAESAAEILEKLHRFDEAVHWAGLAVERSGGSQHSQTILKRIQSQL